MNMFCPDSDEECDNPGCRRGGCQGRRPHVAAKDCWCKPVPDAEREAEIVAAKAIIEGRIRLAQIGVKRKRNGCH